MTIFNDAARTIEIVIRTWDEANGRWSPDWSDDFYQAAAKDVPDVQYCIDQARDMRDGKGDYSADGPQADVDVTVTDLDHEEYMRGHLRDLWYSDATLEGSSFKDGYTQSIDGDQVMLDGRPAYDMYRFTVDTNTDNVGASDHVSFHIKPEDMAAFVTDEFDDPDHATRDLPAVSAAAAGHTRADAPFDSSRPVTSYGQLETMIGGGRHPGDASDVFLGVLDDYDQVTGRDGYADQEIMVQELLDALNRRLNPLGLDATYSGDVYRNVDADPDSDDVSAAFEAFWDEDFDVIIQRHDTGVMTSGPADPPFMSMQANSGRSFSM